MKRINHFLFGAFLLVCLLPMKGSATQMIPLSVAELAKKARLVLQGTVLSKMVQRDPEGRIYTKIELQVKETWKGAAPTAQRFWIVQAGGILGEVAEGIDGQEEFAIGEEVVLFLVLNAKGEGVVLGLSQGKFQVWQDAVSGQNYAQNLFHGTGSGKDSKANSAQNDKKLLTLSELKRQVQGARP